MKHSYRPECDCARCAKERKRRDAQSDPQRTIVIVKARKVRSRRPVAGSQEWAETRGDDLDYSGDY